MKSWTRFLLSHAIWVILFSFAIASVGAVYSIHLFSNLKAEIEELLPSQARSVLDLNEVRARLESTNNINLVIFSDHPEESK